MLSEVRGHDDSKTLRVIELLKKFLNNRPVDVIDGGIELRRPVAALPEMREFSALNDETGVLGFPSLHLMVPDQSDD